MGERYGRCGARSALLGYGVLALSAACDRPAPIVHQFGGPTMGSTFEVKFVGDVPVAKVRAVVEQQLADFDLCFSNWREDSEIIRCNQHRSCEPFAASPRFLAVLQRALEVAAATEGAFDPTVKPLSDLYRAAKRDPQHHLDAAALAVARQRVDYRAVEVQPGAVHKLRPEVTLDLDGIVAGAAADAIAQQLDALGVLGFYLQITGEVYCRGEKAPGEPWLIGVVDPASDLDGGDVPITSLALRDRGLCTSGDYRNAMVVDGRLVHHVFDPRTGHSAEHGVVSVSVCAASAAFADAIGTACMVLGEADARRLLPSWREREHGEVGLLFLLAGQSEPSPPGPSPSGQNASGSLRSVAMDWPR